MESDSVGSEITLPTISGLAGRREDLRRVLAKPHLAAAAAEYERVREESGRHPDFYSLWGGPKSLELLADTVGRAGQYEFLYRFWSKTTHALDLARQLRAVDGQPAVQRLRAAEDLRQVYSLAISFGLAGMRTVLTHYRPGELDGWFPKWYVERIQPGYRQLVQRSPPEPPAPSGGGSG
jgi:hypothetical protein